MTGWLARRQEAKSTRERANRARVAAAKIGAEALAARRALLARFKEILADEPPERQGARLGEVFADERLGPGIGRWDAHLARLAAAKAAVESAPEGNLAEAVETLERLIDEYRANLSALRAWARARAGTMPKPGETLEPDEERRLVDTEPIEQDIVASLPVDRDLLSEKDLLVRARLLNMIGRPADGLQDAETAAGRPGASVEAFELHAAFLIQLRRSSEAAAAYLAAYEAHDSPELLHKAGTQLLYAGRHRDALDAAERVLASDPSDVHAAVLRAHALRFLTRFEEAVAAYRDISRLPDPPDVRLGLARCLAAIGEDEALAAVLASLRAGGLDDASDYAHALYAAHRYVEAEAVARDAIADPALDDRNRRVLTYVRPAFEFAVADFEEALRHVDELLREPSRDGDLHECRALILADLGRLDEALAAARHATELEPDKLELAGTLGRLLRFDGDAGAALPLLEKAAAARPGRIEGQADRACDLVQLGRLDEARAIVDAFPAAAAADPNALYARACLAWAESRAADAREWLAKAAAIRAEAAVRATIDPLLRGLAAR